MSANKKKNLEQDKMDSDKESSSSEDDGPHPDAYKGNEEIQVDFEGRNPLDIDFHGIRQLLQQLFLKAHINLSQLSEIIIEQNYIGSVVIQSEIDEEEDDELCDSNVIFGITSVVNMMSKRSSKCIEELHEFIVEKAEKNASEDTFEQFKTILNNVDQHVGFLINERFVNIPAQISVPLLENLYREIKRAKEKHMPYDFKYYMIIVKFYRKKGKKNKPTEDFYSNQEEEIICKEAQFSFEYSVEHEADSGMSGDWLEGDSTMLPFRKVVLFESSRLSDLILTIKDYINE
ncbi:protein BCCIP homolog [Condylostylus longicornis]|uniref:protein BCCIP homolog n=1 Tax=Condylostylus longicornis TaxID=2530218 RepID=UPI00244E390A|nr:protein BCCIP homolog [Condylostylus longicornis]